jgi:hypothetical protein
MDKIIKLIETLGKTVENITGRLCNQQKQIDLLSIQLIAQNKVSFDLIEIIKKFELDDETVKKINEIEEFLTKK